MWMSIFQLFSYVNIRYNTYREKLSSDPDLVHQKPPKTSVWWGGKHGTPPHNTCSKYSETDRYNYFYYRQLWLFFQEHKHMRMLSIQLLIRDPWFPLYLFQFCPIMEVFAHQHLPQLLWPKQLHQISVTHLEEASFELTKHSVHGCIEGMIHISIHKLFPVKWIKEMWTD